MNKIILFFMLIFLGNQIDAQDLIYFNGERVDSLDNGDWYSVNNRLEIVRCKPKLVEVKDEENDFEGKIISVNHESLVLFKTTKVKAFDKIAPLPKNQKWLIGGPLKIKINDQYQLIWRYRPNPFGNDRTLSIMDAKSNSEYEIFRNCELNLDTEEYYGCGKGFFKIELITDIINDEQPEIIISAAEEEEEGMLKLLIGYLDGKYQVLRWTEFE